MLLMGSSEVGILIIDTKVLGIEGRNLDGQNNKAEKLKKPKNKAE